MTDEAPERIWAWKSGIQPNEGAFGLWSEHDKWKQERGLQYVRADIPQAEIDRLTAALAAMTAERDAMRGLLAECADDLESYINAEYPINTRDAYPSVERRYIRDMALVTRVRATLTPETPHDPSQKEGA